MIKLMSFYCLLNKLLDRGAPVYLVKFLAKWYSCQEMKGKWNNHCSSHFGVGNGVRQGSVLSPFLFSLYIDDLSTQLSFSGLRARIADLYLGCLTYADDITLVSPTVAGLQQMLDICTAYANEHHLIYNTKKSVVITFKQRRWKHSSELDVFLNGNRLPNKKKITHLGVVMNSCCIVQGTLEARKRKFFAAVNDVISRLGGSCPKDSV